MQQAYKDVLDNYASQFLLAEVLADKATAIAKTLREHPVAPCQCSGCRPVNPNPNGCIRNARPDAYQYVQAIGG